MTIRIDPPPKKNAHIIDNFTNLYSSTYIKKKNGEKYKGERKTENTIKDIKHSVCRETGKRHTDQKNLLKQL